MSFALIKKRAQTLLKEASFIGHINNARDYKNALALMDELIEEYDDNRIFIEILAISIERWENESKEFEEFNNRIASLGDAVAVLQIIMDQYQLGVNSFPEIGSKSLVSRILNNERRLTADHIQALSKRFGIEPNVFFAIPDNFRIAQ